MVPGTIAMPIENSQLKLVHAQHRCVANEFIFGGGVFPRLCRFPYPPGKLAREEKFDFSPPSAQISLAFSLSVVAETATSSRKKKAWRFRVCETCF